MSTTLTCVSTKAGSLPFRYAMMIPPLPLVRGGPWTEDGFTATTSTPVSAAAANTASSPSCLERS
jgi:hypothetical protein